MATQPAPHVRTYISLVGSGVAVVGSKEGSLMDLTIQQMKEALARAEIIAQEWEQRCGRTEGHVYLLRQEVASLQLHRDQYAQELTHNQQKLSHAKAELKRRERQYEALCDTLNRIREECQPYIDDGEGGGAVTDGLAYRVMDIIDPDAESKSESESELGKLARLVRMRKMCPRCYNRRTDETCECTESCGFQMCGSR